MRCLSGHSRLQKPYLSPTPRSLRWTQRVVMPPGSFFARAAARAESESEHATGDGGGRNLHEWRNECIGIISSISLNCTSSSSEVFKNMNVRPTGAVAKELPTFFSAEIDFDSG